MLFGKAQSVRDYYSVQSHGRIELVNAGVIGWIDAKYPAGHYWADHNPPFEGFVSGHVEKWTEAILASAQHVDFAKFDTNHDGTLAPQELGICIVIPQAGGFGTVRGTAAREAPSYVPLVVGGVALPVVSEVYLDANAGFGVFAHELGHLVFDLPDMYGAPLPAGTYSLMDSSYNDAQLDAYNKWRLGWLVTIDVANPGHYTLRDVQRSGEAMKIPRPGKPEEFFLVENRRRGVYDSALPDEGVAVWRCINKSEGDWGRTNIALIRRAMPPDDRNALWHRPKDGSSPELHLIWADGSDSGLILRVHSPAGDSMDVEVAPAIP
jgi:M6 family metalloprotease-like protein